MKPQVLLKTRKIQIIPADNFKETYAFFRNIASKMAQMSNDVSRVSFLKLNEKHDMSEYEKMSKTEIDEKIKEVYGKTLQAIPYESLKKYNDIPSRTRALLVNNLFSKINKSFYEIIHNKVSLPTFTKDSMPIPVTLENDDYKFIDKDYFFSCYKFKFKVHFGRDKSNNKLIFERILSGEYTTSTSNIVIENKKMFLLITYKFSPDNSVAKDQNKVLGIDIGINRPVALATNYAKFTQQINIGGKIQHTRMGLFKQRKSLQSALKFNSGGHGRKAKLSRLEKLKDYEHNVIKNFNNIISKQIVDYCLSECIGVINLEDLTDITKDAKTYFLKSWPYYQLQQMIEYKSAEKGIKVLYINPEYTSQTCSCCGNKDNEQRSGTIFKCSNQLCDEFDIEKDADINAAKNISLTKGVDKKLLTKKGKKKLEVSE